MGLLTFKGGIHPYDGKALTKDKPIREIFPKGELVYPISQHIGAPATPIVAVGDKILRGQKIAEANGFISVPVYSSVSGTVKAIEPRRVASGDMVTSIVVENDGEMKEVEFEVVNDYTKLSKEQIIEKIKESGLVGLGGAGFPTYVKLSPKEPDKIDYVIANCAECEPYLTSDYRIMLDSTDKLIHGMKIILQLFPKAKGVFAIEDNKPDCIAKIKEAISGESRMEVAELMTKYPQGGERQIIYAVTKRSINSKMLPADGGCIVQNAETLVKAYNAVAFGRPMMSRVVTVTGNAITEPQNFRALIGSDFSELVEAAGGLKTECKKMISGGPMMGISLFDMHVPVTKNANALLCFTEDEVAAYEPTACINCGRCVEACPEQLVPAKISVFSERSQVEEFEKWHGMECMECGSCSYVCPAKRPLTQYIKTMRRSLLAARKK